MYDFGRGCRLARFGVACLLAWTAETQGQTEPTILHEALECIEQDRFPVVDAAIEPGAELRTAKVYFRSEQFPDFYYVEMRLVENTFVGVLPKPAPETKRVFYYIEAVDFAFNGSRNEEHDPQVRERCKRRDGAAYVPGEDPGIIVGAVNAGGSAIPPGFQTAGIAGFITAAGMGSAAGGGVGVGTAVAVGAGVAGGVAGVVVATGDEETPTTTVPSGGPAPTTNSVLGGTPSPTTTTVPGSPTTTVPPSPSTTTIPGPTTTTTTTAPTTTTTIAAPTTTTTTAPASVTACFTVSKNDCRDVEFTATCSSGPIVRYEWVLDTTGVMQTKFVSRGSPGTFDEDWDDDCTGGAITFELTVVRSDGQTDTKSMTVFVAPDTLKIAPETAELQTSFTSFLTAGAPNGRIRGQVVLNGTRIDNTDNSSPYRHRFRGRGGENIVEAHTVSRFPGMGLWRFDFTGAEHFLAASLEAEQGVVVAVNDHSIVFRQSGAHTGHIKFKYRLSP